MIHIGSSYSHYEKLLERIEPEKIESRYQYLYEEIIKFIDSLRYDRPNIGEKLFVNERALMHCILEYFEDIEKVKSAHDLNNTNSPKVNAYMAYWFLRRHPIQIATMEDDDDDLMFVNEKFVLSMLISFLTQGSESKPLNEQDLKLYKNFINSFYYFLKFRRLDPQSIEMILLSFRLGGVFPECRDIE